MAKEITYEEIKSNKTINTLIQEADKSLKAMGYTEHSFVHVSKTAKVVKMVLSRLKYSKHDVELGEIAGYMHDIGNVCNRVDHAQSGALMAFNILRELEMPIEDVATIITAIGNHDEATAFPVSPIAAALILGDKTDVRRTRVRNTDLQNFDIHDRVNYSVIDSDVVFYNDSRIELVLTIDTSICPVMEYFEIFLSRMLLCRKAADALKLEFKLKINGLYLM